PASPTQTLALDCCRGQHAGAQPLSIYLGKRSPSYLPPVAATVNRAFAPLRGAGRCADALSAAGGSSEPEGPCARRRRAGPGDSSVAAGAADSSSQGSCRIARETAGTACGGYRQCAADATRATSAAGGRVGPHSP